MSRVTVTRANVTSVRYNSKYAAGAYAEAVPGKSRQTGRPIITLRTSHPGGQDMTPEGARQFGAAIVEMAEGMGA